MFKNLPLEIENKILFMSHPRLHNNIQNQIKNYKYKKCELRFNHDFETLLWVFKP